MQTVFYKILRKTYPYFDHLYNSEWKGYPLGNQPRSSRSEYQSLWEEEKQNSYPVLDSLEEKYGFRIDKEWMDELALYTQVSIKKSGVCYQHGRILYSVLRNFVATHSLKGVNIFETGTGKGFSSLIMSRALQDSNIEGKILTFDFIPHETPIYWNAITDHEGARSRRKLLGTYEDLADRYIIYVQGDTRVSIPKIYMGRVHFAFLDGAHTFEDVLKEFDAIKDKQQPGDMIVFDDYTPSTFPGVVQAVDEISDKFNYSKEVVTSSSLRGYAVCTKR